MKVKATQHGLDAGDWLLILYLCKWSGAVTAPMWLFVYGWVTLVLGIVSAVVEAARED